MRRRQRREERRGMSDLERRIEGQQDLDRAGRNFMDFLNHGENVRQACSSRMRPPKKK